MTEITRRDLLIGAAAGAAVVSLPAGARAKAPMRLHVDTHQIDVFGKAATRYAVHQGNGKIGVTLNEGDTFDIELANRLKAPTLVHWHGFIEPWRQDGVPNLSSPPIPPGGTRRFTFPAKPAGTRWMHSHFGLQEQNLLSAPFIVRERSAIAAGLQEVVVMLDDFTWKTPAEIFHGLRNMKMSNTTKDSTPDLNDVDYDAVLANERTLDDPQVVRADGGSTVRLRIINSAASSNFTVDLGAAVGTLIAVDGEPIASIMGSRFPIAVAQRLDIMVTMPRTGTVTVLANAEGRLLRAGIVLATKDAAIRKLPLKAPALGPQVTLALEKTLRARTPLAPRKPDRKFRVELRGTMQRYVWNMAADGLPGMPISADKGQRVEVEMVNTTKMAHPMHLHGHVFQVVAIDGKRFSGAVRDSVLVGPKERVTFAFDAGNPGLWAFHCHNLYHLAAGMFTTMVYRDFA